MPVIYQKWITREDLKNNRNVLYLFGDNLQRTGMGGQAKEMRGEPNAIGVATKHAPGRAEHDFFSDRDYDYNTSFIAFDLRKPLFVARRGGIVVIPLDGLGTGLSEMPIRAPRTFAFLQGQLLEIARAGT